MKILVPSISALAAALACSVTALAASPGRDVPFSFFTDKDRQLFEEALDGALDKGADGAKRTWSNAETKARGEVQPVKTFERGGTPCRTVTIANHAKGRSASGPYTFCKAASGKWTLVPADSQQEPRKKP